MDFIKTCTREVRYWENQLVATKNMKCRISLKGAENYPYFIWSIMEEIFTDFQGMHAATVENLPDNDRTTLQFIVNESEFGLVPSSYVRICDVKKLDSQV